MKLLLSLRAATAASATLAVFLTGCGSADDPEPRTQASQSSSTPETTTSPRSKPSTPPAAPSGPTITVTIEGDEFSPQVQRVDARVGEPITLAIESDVAGELHVHSNPEQEVAFGAGESTHEITIDQPGVVEVESHDLGVIVQLQVQ